MRATSVIWARESGPEIFAALPSLGSGIFGSGSLACQGTSGAGAVSVSVSNGSARWAKKLPAIAGPMAANKTYGTASLRSERNRDRQKLLTARLVIEFLPVRKSRGAQTTREGEERFEPAAIGVVQSKLSSVQMGDVAGDGEA
jgi:hypothetical protein